MMLDLEKQDIRCRLRLCRFEGNECPLCGRVVLDYGNKKFESTIDEQINNEKEKNKVTG